jgi:hypothetical protein
MPRACALLVYVDGQKFTRDWAVEERHLQAFMQPQHDIGLGMIAMVVRTILGKRHVPANYTQMTVAMYLRCLGIRAREAIRIASMPLKGPGDRIHTVLSVTTRKQRRAE